MAGRKVIERNVLHRFWLARLQHEHSTICRIHGVELRLPLFELSGGRKELGCWLSESRCIKISEHLIADYPWTTTVQVLRHEMAHQYCSEILEDSSGGHGRSFKAACDRLGVLPEFRRAGVGSEEFLRALGGESDKDESSGVVEKIEKLLALGQSSNIHEAELALEKARLLMDKYQVQQLGSDQSYKNYTLAVIEMGSRQVATYRRYICQILQDYFFVRVVLSETYLPLHNDFVKTLELLGTKENVAVAEYCYYFLENNLQFLWQQFRVATGAKGRREKNSYYLGVVTGYYGKLEAQNMTLEPKSRVQKELMVMEDARLTSFLQICHPRLVRSSSRRSLVDQETYERGMVEGQKLNFSPGVAEGGHQQQKYLK